MMKQLTIVLALSLQVLSTAAVAIGNPNQPYQNITTLQILANTLVEAGSPAAIVTQRWNDSTKTAAAGLAEIAREVRARSKDHFRGGSTTKPWTAVAVLHLKYLGNLLPQSPSISIRNLLQMESGLFDVARDPNFQTPATRYKYWSPTELVQHGRIAIPITLSSECSFEKVTGKPIADTYESVILRPLRLRHTSFPINATTLPSPALHGYLGDSNGNWTGNATSDLTDRNPSFAFGNGNIVTPGHDLAEFWGSLFAGKLLNQTTFSEMLTTVPTNSTGLGGIGSLDYGLGVYSLATPCGTAYGHVGVIQGYQILALHNPSNNATGVVTLTTNNPPMNLVNAYIGTVLQLLCQKFE
ncbi:hypothetical protein BZG36_05030 [Bifiguratus adelaidae]|uniref:Beta-lactamase-related domain-containing protein n=1 Tax=Bifiguratus adelaidae TaxID=1938954 RepID=A0A261XV71_9FUNG|nr:hypothetical protein BZG36_05030 [Bifiguratus adelaidae]